MSVNSDDVSAEVWPALPFAEWKDTAATLHMWTQVVGKIRLALSPWTNHSWHVTLYLTARGLTTSPIPFGDRILEIRFDFVSHELRLLTSDGQLKTIPLARRLSRSSTGPSWRRCTTLGIEVQINTTPNEVDPAIPFESDETETRPYDPGQYAIRFCRVLLQSDRRLHEFRRTSAAKCSPVHFFWGSFDLAVTRFSGRRAPQHPGGVPHLPDAITREAYSHEVSSLGFWPGNEMMPEPIFYSYAYPEPRGFSEAKVQPSSAAYNPQLKEFVLRYDEMRQSESPDATLLQFARSTYDAASTQGNWDRAALTEVKPDLHSRPQRS